MKNVDPVEGGNESHLKQLASVGQIAAGIAHEVRNPLTAVKGFLQLLEKDNKQEYIQIAQSELDNALLTLNNLLQVSKPDQENEEFQTIHVSVELESIINLSQDQLYNIELVTNFKNTEATIFGQKNQFKKAFFNLIKNAIESIEDKGSITIEHYSRDNEVIVVIEDTGVGIPEEKLSILGTPFYTTKENGTGMGLTQVFSTVYQHGGNIFVESEKNRGTKFTIKIPKGAVIGKGGAQPLKVEFAKGIDIKEFFLKNEKQFSEKLLNEAINVRDKIEEINRVGNINLIGNAHRLVLYVVENQRHELISFAKQEGIAWAKYSLTVAFKLEWIQAIRRTLWDFLYNFDELNETAICRKEFFKLEKEINELIDQFLNYFFLSYTKYRDEVLETQKKLVENLSVPIIPITAYVCILPLIGSIDLTRVHILEDKVITEIGQSHIQTLIVDLSGVANIEMDVFHYLNRIFSGIFRMGCKTVLTGLRPEIVKIMVSSGIDFEHITEYKGTLQLALNDFVSLK